MPGAVPVTEPTAFQGPVRALGKETDGEIWIQGWDFFFDLGTWTMTRVARGNWTLRKTAAANTPKLGIFLEPYLWKKIGTDPELAALTGQTAATKKRPSHDIRGAQVIAIDVVYGIGTASLNSHAFTLDSTVYANNVANAVTNNPGGTVTGTLATATQANPYVTTLTPGTLFIPGANTQDTATTFEIQIDAAATSVYDFYGIMVRFNYNWL